MVLEQHGDFIVPVSKEYSKIIWVKNYQLLYWFPVRCRFANTPSFCGAKLQNCQTGHLRSFFVGNGNKPWTSLYRVISADHWTTNKVSVKWNSSSRFPWRTFFLVSKFQLLTFCFASVSVSFRNFLASKLKIHHRPFLISANLGIILSLKKSRILF